jgi:hypothetical protein
MMLRQEMELCLMLNAHTTKMTDADSGGRRYTNLLVHADEGLRSSQGSLWCMSILVKYVWIAFLILCTKWQIVSYYIMLDKFKEIFSAQICLWKWVPSYAIIHDFELLSIQDSFALILSFWFL